MRHMREDRLRNVKRYAGPRFGADGSERKVDPVNLIQLYISIISPNLIAKTPRVMLSTDIKQFKPIVASMERWANKEFDRIHLDNTLQRCVLDALFCIGIAKIAIATPEDAAQLAWRPRAGDPFISTVDFDDYVYDTNATDFYSIDYEGHRYRAPLDIVRENKRFSKYRKDLEESENRYFNPQGDERLKQLGVGYYGNNQDTQPKVDLWEIYSPRERCVRTFIVGESGDCSLCSDGKPLCEQDWIGPDAGPYEKFVMATVPGQAMGLAPIPGLVPLHDAANNAARKMIDTVRDLKELTLFQGQNDTDQQNINDAPHGTAVRVQCNPKEIQQILFRGQVLQSLDGMFREFKELFSEMGGNLTLLGGRGPQSKTATQDTMLDKNAAVGIQDMQQRTYKFTSAIMEKMLWFHHMHPTKVMKDNYSPLPGISTQTSITPQMRAQVDWDDLEVKVDPYSLRDQTPETRMAGINQVMTQIVLPMGQLLQQQGIIPDMREYLKVASKYMDLPELADIVTYGEPPAPTQGGDGGGDTPGMPANTNREYTRHNVSEQTEQGQNRNMIAQMLTGNSQGGQNGQLNGAMQ